MHIPKLRSVEGAIRLYYENIELSNKEIKELFESRTGENLSSSTIMKLKNAVYEEAAKRGILMWEKGCVNTELAYEVWGLDIKNLEYRLSRLKKLQEKQAV